MRVDGGHSLKTPESDAKPYWQCAPIVVVIVVLSGLVFIALHWRGIPLSPDGWAYWQAAASIANGMGYRDFAGTPLTAWPPLYSLYLSLWVRVMGATGLALVVANGVLIVLQSLAWFTAIYYLWNLSHGVRRTSTSFAVAIYVAVYVPLTLQAAHSANLGFLCNGLTLVATWQLSQIHAPRYRFRWLLAAVAAATFALLSHNINLAFVVGCASALIIARHQSRSDVAFALALVIVPLILWIFVRWQLGQLNSHPIGFGLAQFSPVQYIAQMAIVIGNLIVPNKFGAPVVLSAALLAWCVWILVSGTQGRGRTGARFTAAIVVLASALIVLLFSVTSVTDPIGVRFVGWVPVLIVPALLIYSSRVSLSALIVVAAIVLAPNIHRVAVFAAIHAVPQSPGETGVLFPIGALISPEYTTGPSVQTDHGLLIAPPK